MATALKQAKQIKQTESDNSDESYRANAFEVATLLKVLGNEGRLMILVYLGKGEKSVKELQDLLNAPQALVSSHLARLRYEGLVTFRKDAQCSFYSLKDNKAVNLLNLVDSIFCGGLGRKNSA